MLRVDDDGDAELWQSTVASQRFHKYGARYLEMSSLHSVSVTKGHTIMSTTKSTRVLRGAAAGAVCLALAFGTAGVALAGSRSHDRGYTNSRARDNGPQSNDASGVVSTLGTNSITLKGRHGTTTTYTTVPGTTTYFEGKTAGVAGDLVVGDRVNLDADHDLIPDGHQGDHLPGSLDRHRHRCVQQRDLDHRLPQHVTLG